VKIAGFYRIKKCVIDVLTALLKMMMESARKSARIVQKANFMIPNQWNAKVVPLKIVINVKSMILQLLPSVISVMMDLNLIKDISVKHNLITPKYALQQLI